MLRIQRVEPNKTLALSRVNSLLERVFSVAASLVGLQTFTNALTQYSEHVLHPFWFWLNFALLGGAHLSIVYLVWIHGDGRLGFIALTVSTLFSIITWTFQLGDGSLRVGEQPWIWWSVGVAGISAVGGFGVFLSGFFLVILPAMWFFLKISDIGIPVPPLLALQDASFSFLFSSVLAGFVWVLRYESSKVDEANQKANIAAIDLARADAILRERDRVDALVHDSVLTTLLVAAKAEDQSAQRHAQELAETAIQKLITADTLLNTDESISVSSLFSALEVAIQRQSEVVSVEIEGSTDHLVPGEVADAVAESTLQALANALNHAGANATVQVFLKGTAKGFKIVVKDNGRGFRPSRVPKNRVGLKLSIIGRVQAVGGKVFIDSKIGIGTNVIIEWSAA
jgi:signal transduction histidine kinase